MTSPYLGKMNFKLSKFKFSLYCCSITKYNPIRCNKRCEPLTLIKHGHFELMKNTSPMFMRIWLLMDNGEGKCNCMLI